ncbi:MAG: FHA domain-containing protein [Victivallales bacterium]|nr:FHA domain-containing protein [Victivallales bacterium]
MKIFFTDGHKAGTEKELAPPGISIGRELDNDIVLEQEGASRYHAKIDWVDDAWFLKDLGSTNGTRLNGSKITPNEPVRLNQGDKIRIGQQTMLFAENPVLDEQESMPPLIKLPDPAVLNDSHSVPTLTESETEQGKTATPPQQETQPKDDVGIAGSGAFLDFFTNKETSSDHPTATATEMDFFKKTDDTKAPSQPRKHAGVLFYVAVIGVAVILIAGFLLFEKIKAEGKPPPQAVKKVRTGASLLIKYEKQVTTSSPKQNIFRYVLEIVGDTATITRDDLQAGLKDQPSRKVPEERLNDLEEKLQETDFMSLEQSQSGLPRGGEDRRIKLSIAYGKEFNSILVHNTSPPRAFDEAVRIIEDFCENVLNVRALSLTPEELRADGMNAYRKGKQLFENHLAQHDNLYRAEKLLNVAVENLGSFQPEPPEYAEAYRMRTEALRILEEQIRAHDRNANNYRRLKQYSDAIEEYKLIMQKTEPGSKNHAYARERVIQLEAVIRATRKRK